MTKQFKKLLLVKLFLLLLTKILKSILQDRETMLISPRKPISENAYKIEGLNTGLKRNIIEKGYFAERYYPFLIQPDFSTLGSFINISSYITGSLIDFNPDESIRDVLGFKSVIEHEEIILSHEPVEILSSDNFLRNRSRSRNDYSR